MPDGIVLMLPLFLIFFFFLSYQSLGKTICVHTGSHNFGRFSCYHSQKNVLIEILEHPFTARHIKKTRKSPRLGYIHLPLVDFRCCLLLHYLLLVIRCITKIFLRREMSTNVYNVLHIETLEVR